MGKVGYRSRHRPNLACMRLIFFSSLHRAMNAAPADDLDKLAKQLLEHEQSRALQTPGFGKSFKVGPLPHSFPTPWLQLRGVMSGV